MNKGQKLAAIAVIALLAALFWKFLQKKTVAASSSGGRDLSPDVTAKLGGRSVPLDDPDPVRRDAIGLAITLFDGSPSCPIHYKPAKARDGRYYCIPVGDAPPKIIGIL